MWAELDEIDPVRHDCNALEANFLLEEISIAHRRRQQ
jgi:hypothetical protein